MGTKDVARETMRQAGVPIVPGSTGIVADEQDGFELLKKLVFQLSSKQQQAVEEKGFVLQGMMKS